MSGDNRADMASQGLGMDQCGSRNEPTVSATAALAWVRSEIERLERASSRSSTVSGVVRACVAENNLRRILSRITELEALLARAGLFIDEAAANMTQIGAQEEPLSLSNEIAEMLGIDLSEVDDISDHLARFVATIGGAERVHEQVSQPIRDEPKSALPTTPDVGGGD